MAHGHRDRTIHVFVISHCNEFVKDKKGIRKDKKLGYGRIKKDIIKKINNKEVYGRLTKNM